MDRRPRKIDKRNNFDLIRLVLAFWVMLFHFSTLSGAEGLSWFPAWIDVWEALAGFFILSGFMIFPSYEKSVSIADYASKRIRRIYPAYASVILFCAALGALLTSLPVVQYALSPELYKYLAYNLLALNFLQPSLPGVFTANTYSAVNGALWTIKVELMFYAAAPIIIWMMRRMGRLSVMIALYVLGMAYNQYFNGLYLDSGREAYFTLSKQLPGQLPYLMSGALLYYYLDVFRRRSHLYFAIALAVYVPSYMYHFRPLMPIALAAMIVYAGLVAKYIGNFGRYGDLSYGIYIFHFPVVQSIVHFGLPAAGLVASFALTVSIVCALAFASWHLVEKRALAGSSHYVQAAAKGG